MTAVLTDEPDPRRDAAAAAERAMADALRQPQDLARAALIDRLTRAFRDDEGD